jgi:hypothetical protein
MDKMLALLKRYGSDGTDPVSRGAMRRGDMPLGRASELLDRYRGMEGVPVPVADSTLAPNGFGSWASLDQLTRGRRSSGEDIDLICVAPMPQEPQKVVVVPGFEFCGYDCGVFASSDFIYSVILHEVLFGKFPELVRHAAALNERGLFDEWNDAESLMALRSRLSDLAGGSLEVFHPGDNPGVIAVFEAREP